MSITVFTTAPIFPCSEPHSSSPLLVTLILFKIHFNIIPHSTSRYSKWPLFFRFSHQNLTSIYLLPQYVLHAPPIAFTFVLYLMHEHIQNSFTCKWKDRVWCVVCGVMRIKSWWLVPLVILMPPFCWKVTKTPRTPSPFNAAGSASSHFVYTSPPGQDGSFETLNSL